MHTLKCSYCGREVYGAPNGRCPRCGNTKFLYHGDKGYYAEVAVSPEIKDVTKDKTERKES